jgi:hypothetical protein
VTWFVLRLDETDGLVSGWALARGDQADTYSMYIREIARSLYQLKRQLEELEQAYEVELPGEKRDDLERELYRVRMEYHKVKNILEGAKDSP